MLSNTCMRTAFAHRRAARGLIIAMTVSAGGCSADVTRFDFPAFALTNSGAGAPTTGSLSGPPQPVARGYQSYDESASNPPPSRSYAAEPLPPPKVAVATAPPTDRFTARHMDRLQPARYQAGETIEVQPGDTIFVLARRHGVSIDAIIELNGLKNGSSLQPGQRITLPAGAKHVREAVAARAPMPAPAAPTAPAAPQPTALAGGWDGQHTMKGGESLYGIARQYKVALTDLQRVNGITEPTKVRIGTVLRVPGHAQPPMGSRVAQDPMAPPARSRLINAPVEQEQQQPMPERRVAALGDRANDAGPAEAGSGKFRWPVRGRIIANFGKRNDGTHNDGINLAVPQGTEIHAVEGGKVAYAGNELKGYGNLVLIRHDNGWVSAYAHADQVLVKRDDIVRRGQVIAKAGKTGTVDQPQLHFELRQGSKPVDPVPHLEGN
jgi:murein DD-endopeptidase MepM/ murein hydrolase activator NlpD